MESEESDVRSGEELDLDRLAPYLKDRLLQIAGDPIIKQFRGGSSNLTYAITFGKQEFVLRRPPFGNTVRTAHDMRREFDVLSRLSQVYAPAPKPVLFCDDESIIGSDFYLMERRRGLIVRGELDLGMADGRAVCRSFIRNLAELHALDYKAAGLAELGKPDGYNRRQVEGWTKRYFAAKTHEFPELEESIAWLNDNVPAESGAALIHNDYKFDNVMLDPDDLTSITAVLDWEMVTVGDPLMDLGTTLGYWMSEDAGEEMMSMPFNPRVLMQTISRRELVEMYVEESGREVANPLFYYVFGTFKVAVIAQQIYARYAKGLTRDKRFARFDAFVAQLGNIASSRIGAGKI